jgi:hypothetical protein
LLEFDRKFAAGTTNQVAFLSEALFARNSLLKCACSYIARTVGADFTK